VGAHKPVDNKPSPALGGQPATCATPEALGSATRFWELRSPLSAPTVDWHVPRECLAGLPGQIVHGDARVDNVLDNVRREALPHAFAHDRFPLF
jgi:hypothetical protein